jgi:hypothetical protein
MGLLLAGCGRVVANHGGGAGSGGDPTFPPVPAFTPSTSWGDPTQPPVNEYALSGAGFDGDMTVSNILIPPATLGFGISCAFAGGVYLLAWSNDLPGDPSAVIAVRYDRELRPLDATPLFGWPGYLPRVISTGDDFVLLWEDSNQDTHEAHVSPAGQVLSQTILGALDEPQGAYAQGAVMLTWTGAVTPLGITVQAQRISVAGEFLDPQPRSPSSTTINNPMVASDGSQFLLAWQEGGSKALNYQRIASTGTNVGMAMALPDTTVTFPVQLVYGSGGFLAIWTDQSALYTRLIHSDGSYAAGTATYPTMSYDLSAVAAPGGYLIGLVDGSGTTFHLEGIKIDAQGTIGMTVPLSPAEMLVQAPTIASDGSTSVLVVWGQP